MRELRRMDKPVKRVMIGGGGNIGRRLAKQIENRYEVKLIEFNKAAAERLAAELDKTLVLAGDVTDEELLREENIDEMDVYCALTNDDENNIMCSLLAKRMGARKVIALINRGSYVNLVQAGRSTSRSRPRRRRSGRCSRTCAAATAPPCIRCGAARRKRSSWSRTATRSPRRWSAGASRSSTCRRAPRIGAIVRRHARRAGRDERGGAGATTTRC